MAYKVAGIDVHKKVLMVVILDVDDPGSEPQRRRFGTTTSELQNLSSWLRQQGVQQAVMESTAQYWRPVWYELEPYMKLQLAQAFSNRAPRGRKHDFRDAERLIRRLLAGELTLSFVPGAQAADLADDDTGEGAAQRGQVAAAQPTGVSAGGDADQAVQCDQ